MRLETLRRAVPALDADAVSVAEARALLPERSVLVAFSVGGARAPC